MSIEMTIEEQELIRFVETVLSKRCSSEVQGIISTIRCNKPALYHELMLQAGSTWSIKETRSFLEGVAFIKANEN